MTAPLWLVVVTGIVSAFGGAVAAYVALRKDKREQRDAEREAATETIRLLNEQKKMLIQQNDLLTDQNKDLRKRIESLEQWKNDEIQARKRLQMCRKAPDCTNFDPGFAEITD